MYVPMPEGTRLSPELREWARFAIADAVVLFGRMEQEIIEISWILNDDDLTQKLKLTGGSTTDKFIAALESVERAEEGLKLDALKDGFKGLAEERNLIVHGAWNMTDEKPWVVWHKFLEDDESIIGEHFERWRFERFMVKGQHIFPMLRRFHYMLEAQTGKKTSAVPRA
jgi:hypothetical protein